MPSPELVAMLALVPPDFADPEADYLAVRAMMAPFHGHPVPPHVSVEEAVLGGVRSAWCDDTTTAARHRGTVAFHCHGGGLVSCPLDDYRFYGAMLSEQLDLRVVMPDYRLAPEHPYPAAHEDCFNAYRGLLASGADPSRLIVMGDSCGGGLALSTLLAARDEGLAMPAGFISLSGWFDLSVAHPVTEGRDPFLTAQWVRNRAFDYTQGRIALDDPTVSPAFAELRGLPPLYLPVAQFDTVGQGAIALGVNALGAGVRVTLESWPGAVHGWQGLVSVGVPEAVAAFEAMRAFIRSVLPAL